VHAGDQQRLARARRRHRRNDDNVSDDSDADDVNVDGVPTADAYLRRGDLDWSVLSALPAPLACQARVRGTFDL
jgi:hypothetical protein